MFDTTPNNILLHSNQQMFQLWAMSRTTAIIFIRLFFIASFALALALIFLLRCLLPYFYTLYSCFPSLLPFIELSFWFFLRPFRPSLPHHQVSNKPWRIPSKVQEYNPDELNNGPHKRNARTFSRARSWLMSYSIAYISTSRVNITRAKYHAPPACEEDISAFL